MANFLSIRGRDSVCVCIMVSHVCSSDCKRMEQGGIAGVLFSYSEISVGCMNPRKLLINK